MGFFKRSRFLRCSTHLDRDRDVPKLVGHKIRRSGGHPLTAISLPPLQSIGLVTFFDFLGVITVRLVCDLLELFLSSFCLGNFGRDASSALLRVRYGAFGLVAMDNNALALRAVLRVAIKVQMLLLDV